MNTHRKNRYLPLCFLVIILSAMTVLSLSCFTAYAQENEEYSEVTEITEDDFDDYDGEYYDGHFWPERVSELAALNTNTSSVKITWFSDYYGWEDCGYEINLYDAAANEYHPVGTTTEIEYTIYNLNPNTKYQIAVREYSYYNKDQDIRHYGEYSELLTVYTSANAPALKKATYKKPGKIVVKWKKASNVGGYILQYSTSKKFAEPNTCTVLISGTSKAEKTISGLFAKTYYVRLGTYQSDGDKKFCSKWSKVIPVKIKKGASLKAAINSTKTDLSGRKAIKAYTGNGVDIKKYKTTYDRLKAIYNWHAKHYKDFANCLECNGHFGMCVDALYGNSKQYDDFIWISADRFKNNSGSVVMHKWCVIYINGDQRIFDPRMQGYTKDYKGNHYFGITPKSANGKKYLFDYWFYHFRYGYKSSSYIITN